MTRSRRWRASALGVVSLIGLLVSLGPVDSTEAQPASRMDLLDQTVIVGDDPAAIDVSISDPPADARIAVRVHPATTDRATIRESYRDPSVSGGRLISFDRPLVDYSVGGDRYRIELPDEEIGEILRRDAGALPVQLVLLDDEGDTAGGDLVTHVIVMPPPGSDSSGSTDPVPVTGISYLVSVGVPLAHQPDATVTIDGDPLAGMDGLPPAAVTAAVRPETLSALSEIGDTGLLDEIGTAVEATTVTLEPWVELDEEAWRDVGEDDMVIGQYAEGRTTVDDLLATTPSGVVRLDPDATTATLSLLRAAGATTALVEPEALQPSTLEATAGRPFHLHDENGVSMVSITVDHDLADTLENGDPELGAHRAFTELLVMALDGDDDPVAVLPTDDLTDRTGLNELRTLIADSDRVDETSLLTLFEAPPARTPTGSARQGRLLSETDEDPTTSDLSDAAAELDQVRALSGTYAEMVAPAEAPVVSIRTLLASSSDESLDTAGRRAYLDGALTRIADGTAGITVVEPGRITLATRTAELPLTLRNAQPLPVTVDLVLRAEKLEFPGGERRTVRLSPGENTVNVRVEARASGDARVSAELVSADDRIHLDEGVVRVRSTALSGIGLLISGAALLVLFTWWLRTVRRTRRDGSAATVPTEAGIAAEGSEARGET